MVYPGRAPILRTKSYQRNKSMNAWLKYKIWTGFEPRTPGRKANTITTELKRILPTQLLGILFKSGSSHCLKEWSPVTLLQDALYQASHRHFLVLPGSVVKCWAPWARHFRALGYN